jgi:hypothetical protein
MCVSNGQSVPVKMGGEKRPLGSRLASWGKREIARAVFPAQLSGWKRLRGYRLECVSFIQYSRVTSYSNIIIHELTGYGYLRTMQQRQKKTRTGTSQRQCPRYSEWERIQACPMRRPCPRSSPPAQRPSLMSLPTHSSVQAASAAYAAFQPSQQAW